MSINREFKLDEEYMLYDDDNEIDVIIAAIYCNTDIEGDYSDLIKGILLSKIGKGRISCGIHILEQLGPHFVDKSIFKHLFKKDFSKIKLSYETLQGLFDAFVDISNVLNYKYSHHISLEHAVIYNETGLIVLENDEYPYLIDIDILKEIKDTIELVKNINEADNLKLLNMYRITHDEKIRTEILRRMKI